MGPKSKKTRLEFISCSICNTQFNSKDSVLHASLCCTNKPYDVNLKIPHHGFISGDRLCAVTVHIEGIYKVSIPRKGTNLASRA